MPRGTASSSTGSDIRKFFTSVTPKAASKPAEKNDDDEPVGKLKKKKAVIIDSDSDNEELLKPSKKKVKTSPDSEKKPSSSGTSKAEGKAKDKNAKAEPKTEAALKKADVKSVFGDAPISRSKEARKASRASVKQEDVHEDNSFSSTLKSLDEGPASKKQKKESSKSGRKTVKKKEGKAESDSDYNPHDDDDFKATLEQLESPTTKKKQRASPAKLTKVKTSDTPAKAEKKTKAQTKLEKVVVDPVADNKESLKDETESVDPLEKRKQHASNYARYLQSHKQGAKNPGSKTIPEGKEGCLANLTFVVTGILESLQREEAEELVKKYGGKATHSVSSRTSYILAGEDAGPAKLSKAKDLKVPVIGEDEFLEMIATRPGADSQSMSTTPKSAARKKKAAPEVHTSPAKKEEVKPKDKTAQEKTKPSPRKTVQDKSAAAKAPSPQKSSQPDTKPTPTSYLPWVEKYKPTALKQIIGQQGDRSCMKKLAYWLEHWNQNHSGHKKLSRPSPWAKDDNGAFFKAALLSGPPGIGKTTTAHLVSRELGFDMVEMNASDTRSKKLLQEHVSELLSSQSLASYAHGSSSMNGKKRVLIMDEVDGMAGNEDRGGVQELISLIKKSKIPVICICNDRSHPKMRSLVNYCFDLRFSKPRVEQIRGTMLSICFKEGIKIKPEALDEIIIGANQDVRQILSHLSVLSAKEKTLSPDQAKLEASKSRKDFKLGPWDVVRKVFSAEEHKTMSLQDKSNLFFQDYSFGPLFVQENYLQVQPHAAKGDRFKTMDLISKAAESISQTDLIERLVRSQNAWSLLPVEAVFASVVPGELMKGHFTGQIVFPNWFGKNSKQGKIDRLLQELHLHMRLRVSASKRALNMDYLPYILKSIISPLRDEGADGAAKSVKAMESYDLVREDLDSLLEVAKWDDKADPMAGIDGKVKAAFTRLYNKEAHLTPYATGTMTSRGRGKASAPELEGLDDEEDGADDDEDEEDEDIEHDAMIKVKKSKGRGQAAAEKGGVATSSKGGGGGGRGRGKGRGGKR